jgi:hypothetical protein
MDPFWSLEFGVWSLENFKAKYLLKEFNELFNEINPKKE